MKSNALALLGRASPPLLWVGVLGIALAGVCTAGAVARGVVIPPEGDLTKPIAFDAAVGIFAITLAVFVPLAHFGATGWRLWLGAFLGSVLYGYGLETIETLRGFNPRFSVVAGGLDRVAQNLFILTAIGFIGTFIVLAVKLTRRGTSGADGLTLLALGYAIGATMIAFAAGIWMSAIQGRYTGAAGNILLLHALGFHSLLAAVVGRRFRRHYLAPRRVPH